MKLIGINICVFRWVMIDIYLHQVRCANQFQNQYRLAHLEIKKRKKGCLEMSL